MNQKAKSISRDNQKAFQDMWPEIMTYCFGCGRNNEEGLQIKSYWEEDEAVCIWKPKKHHRAGQGLLCGGVITTVMDCHCVNTAMASIYKEDLREIGSKPIIPYVAGTIQIKLLRPARMNRSLTLRAKVKETKGRKKIVECSVFSGRTECARGEVIAIQVPEMFWIK